VLPCHQLIVMRFYTIPIVSKRPNNATPDKHRRAYITLAHQRSLYIDCLKLEHKKGTKYVYICNKHKIHHEYMEIKYKDKNNNKHTYKSYPQQTHCTRSTAVVLSIPPKLWTVKGRKSSAKDENEKSNNAKQHQKNPRVCHFCNCTSRSDNNDEKINFNRVQPPIELDLTQDNSNSTIENIAKNKIIQREILRSMGLSSKDSQLDIRVCDKHNIVKKWDSVGQQRKISKNQKK
jgi:hypothetical protein